MNKPQLRYIDNLRRATEALALGVFTALLAPGSAIAEDLIKKTAIAEFGEPLYAEGIEHFPYANPDAPKGGKIVLSAFGSFDTLNFYVQKGEWPNSIGVVYDDLMTGSSDEIDGLYGLIAESVEYPEDKSYAIFNLREEAVYHDGKPILAADFVFTLETIKEHGRPFIKSFYDDILSAEALSDRRLKFTFGTTDSMKPITTAAGLSPLPVHYWQGKDVTASTLEQPMSSGPYRVKDLDPGRSITYERVEDYWAKDLPIKRGLNNIDEIRYEYYRDLTVEFEAFKAGEIDFRSESSAKRWMTEYDLEEISTGDILKEEVPSKRPRGMGGYFFNLKRDKFSDIRVREAIMTLYDFEAIQRTLLYGQYKRINSYFPNSDYGAVGATTEAEKMVLEPFADQLPEGVLDKAFEPPVTDGSGRDRKNKRRALGLFKAAGWVLKSGKLVSSETGEQFQLELMTAYPESQRLALPYVETLKKSGIDASIRLVDTSQWRVRIHDSDFDMWVGGLNFFPPPGTELRSFFGSESADVRGGNSGGIKNPVVDALIEQIVVAEDIETLQMTTRALDRVLLWNHYAVPSYFNDESWIAYWNRFGRPEKLPVYAIGFPGTWWIDPEKDTALKR
ncbi:MAG: extracellular solute-binding protein [Acidiferrobacterales bacterium]|nr:extracellular solute-binding protein [Acidiferrobacterales bacterium]